jgi:N-acetylglucosaminyldiphosphoundecaprenol N-acetyl-beta-D-mannosaminyltransferase
MRNANLPLLPRATLRNVLGGKAPLVGSRCSQDRPRGFISPIEPRLRMGIPYGDLSRCEEEYFARRSLVTDLGVMVRTAVAWALSPSSGARPLAKPFIVSAAVDNLSITEAIDLILSASSEARSRFIFFVHAHALNLARFDSAYAEVLSQADALLPDGIGIRLAAGFLGVALRHNLNGTDLFPFLCREAAKLGIPVALIGGAPGVADECARRMQADVPRLEIPLVSSGFFGSEAEALQAAARVREMGRVLDLVGMGSPHQERWATRYLQDCPGATVLTVGGLFDFYSGRIRRAPILWREAGFEWLYRVLQEPRRLAKRYLVGNPLFLALAFWQRVSGRRP